MNKLMFVYDTVKKSVWAESLIKVGHTRGWRVKQFTNPASVTLREKPCYIFTRIPMRDPELTSAKIIYNALAELPYTTMIQDALHVELYEDKVAQVDSYGTWLPSTEVHREKFAALEQLQTIKYPFISKSACGASSCNVRLVEDKDQALKEVRQAFTHGIASGHRGFPPQQGYLLWQEFIPHDVTYRVNIIGRQFAIFKRYCYANRPMAQTGNVEPVYELDEKMSSLLQYAEQIARTLGTKWMAFDILESPDGWKLLETTLGWPWPSPGACNKGAFFHSTHQWIDMFKVLFDEIEEGVWG